MGCNQVIGFLMLFSIQHSAGVSATSDIIYVAPLEQYPAACPSKECFTLDNLIKISESHNFSSNTTILLLSGNHITLADNRTELQIQDLEYFEFSNMNSSTPNCFITCSTSIRFAFRNVSNLKITGITFNNCGNLLSLAAYTFNVSLLIKNIFTFTLENVVISNTQGIGLLIQNVHQNLLMSKVNLSHNEINCRIDHNKEALNTSLHYLIIDTIIQFGNVLQWDNFEYYKNTFEASGLRILITFTNRSNITVRNCTFHGNKGTDVSGNFVIKLDKRYLSENYNYPVIYITIIGLRSTHVGQTNRAFSNKGLQLIGTQNTFNIQLYIGQSFFEESCIFISHITHTTLEDVTIQRNKCVTTLWFRNASHVLLKNTTTTQALGYSVILAQGTEIKTSQTNYFVDNKASIGIQLVKESKLIFGSQSSSYIVNNTILNSKLNFYNHASTLYAEHSEIVLVQNTYVKFLNNTASLGGAVTVVASKIALVGPNSTLAFNQNKGSNGGAIAMYDNSLISIFGNKHTTLSFKYNTATRNGGAMYIDTESYLPKRSDRVWPRKIKPFIKVETYTRLCPTFEYINNTAFLSGNDVYGGWRLEDIAYKFCHLTPKENYNNLLLSSHPFRICMCINTTTPNCSILIYPIEIYPGQMFEIQAVAVGWQFGTSPANVQARFQATRNSTKLEGSQNVQRTSRQCTRLSYRVYSQNAREMLHLYVETNNVTSTRKIYNDWLLQQEFSIDISIKDCPPGFEFNKTIGMCKCHTFFTMHNIECELELFKVARTTQAWISASTKNSSRAVIISKHCPKNYCKSSSEMKMLDLENPDTQCSFNRSGVLCGRCQTNLSLVFGTSKCKECSNLWVILIIPTFILAGIALVAFIMVLNLTVSVGTINGLIFYANIVRANQAIFFPPETANSFLSWFVAWINLDLGIEVCFFDGLDAYAKTWFQFLFPLYIWIIVITIIVLSRHFDTVAKLFGNNAVPVLATLFLLSYAKLLRVIITIFQPSQLDFSDGNSKRAWLYDGNVVYFKGKHILLFIVALVMLLFISFPYTAVLLTIQWLQKVNQYRIFFWVNRLKPLLDAYAGPYKDKHRYWTGLLLLDRVILFLIFSLNVSNNPSVNLLAIIVTQILVLSHSFLVGRVYKSRLTNAIELSFHINISLLAATTLFQISTSFSPKLSTNISASIAFIMFVIISIVHLVQRVVKHRFPQHKDIFANLKKQFTPKKVANESEDEATAVATDGEGSGVSTTFVELREPLIDY